MATAVEITFLLQPKSSSSGKINTDGALLKPAVANNVPKVIPATI
jgi:lipoprotein NlpI